MFTHGGVLLSCKECLLSNFECFYSSLGDLWAFLPIYSSVRATANSNVPFSFEAKIWEHYIVFLIGLMNMCRKICIDLDGDEEQLSKENISKR